MALNEVTFLLAGRKSGMKWIMTIAQQPSSSSDETVLMKFHLSFCLRLKVNISLDVSRPAYISFDIHRMIVADEAASCKNCVQKTLIQGRLDLPL
jgi:hypothetical protein